MVTLEVTANDGTDIVICQNCVNVTEPTGPEDPEEPEEEPDENTTANADGDDGEIGEPVSAATGELYFSRTHFLLGGPFPSLFFSRYYATLLTDDSGAVGTMGTNWMHNFDLSLDVTGTEAKVTYFRGKVVRFSKTGEIWTLSNPEPTIFQLIESGTGYALMDPSRDLICVFDQTGRLMTLKNRNGKTLTLTYMGDRVSEVTDGLGRSLSFLYTAGKLTEVQDQTGRSLALSYTGDDLTGFTDAMGNTTGYSYTAAGGLSGLLTAATMPRGNRPYTQTYDSRGRVQTQTDSEGYTTTMSYDTPSDGTTRMTDPLGYVTEFTHQGKHKLVAHKDAAGEVTSIAYDENGRRNRITDRLGNVTVITYHEASGKMASFTDAVGNTTRLQYTEQAQEGFCFYNLTRIDYPDGTWETLDYDNTGNMLTRTDQAGAVWAYTYNGRGQVLTATNPRGGVTTITYNPDATPATIRDHAGQITNLAYDDMKRLVRVTHPDGTFRSFTFDDNDQLLTETDERGKIVAYNYDANGNLSAVTDPLGNTATSAYDGNDKIISTVDPLNKTFTFTYDERERLKTQTNPLAETVTLGYAPVGWPETVEDPAGKTTIRAYNQEGMPLSFSDPLGNSWNYTPDEEGRIIRRTSPLGHAWDYQHDAMGRVSATTSPLAQTTSFSYDPRGLLTGLALPEEIMAVYLRDALGKIYRIIDPGGNIWSSSYDAMGRLSSETDPLANTTSVAYDNRNRPDTINYPEGSLRLFYDEAGNITRRLYSDGTDLFYTHDDNNRVLTSNEISLGYDARGDIISCNGMTVIRDDAGRIAAMDLAPGKTVQYSYNSRGLVSQVSDWAGGTTGLTYDDAGRLTALSRPNGIVTHLTYDPDGYITGMTEQGADGLSSIQLTRDGLGNVIAADRSVPLEPDLSPEATEFSFDAAGQLSGSTYDKMGRLLADGRRVYTWDLASRLITCGEKGATATFSYDGFGMRVSRLFGGVTRRYVWNYAPDLPVVSIIREGGNDLTYYIHLPDGKLLHGIDASSNARRFYHFDETGSTLFLTDDNGAITDSYGIAPYGAVTAATGGTDNPFKFIGAYGVMEEGDSGLYYMRARYYDSESGRFISRDPIAAIHPQEINPYQYARNNPLRYIDPTGMKADNPHDPFHPAEGYRENEIVIGYQGKQPIIDVEKTRLWRKEIARKRHEVRVKKSENFLPTINPIPIIWVAADWDALYKDYQTNADPLFYFRGRVMMGAELNYYFYGLLISEWGAGLDQEDNALINELGVYIWNKGGPSDNQLHLAKVGWWDNEVRKDTARKKRQSAEEKRRQRIAAQLEEQKYQKTFVKGRDGFEVVFLSYR